MNILTINAGSVSIKIDLVEMPREKSIISIRLDKAGNKPKLFINGKIENNNLKSTKQFLLLVNSLLKNYSVDIITHRIVHGGKIAKPQIINSSFLKKMNSLIDLAPIHNSFSIEVIKESLKQFKGKKQIAVFDTSFHNSIPQANFLYAIPEKYYEKYGVRKYGFHGLSFSYALDEAKKFLNKNPNLIICHLGGGSSICAIKSGKSIDTTMGFTPLSGLMMGTRSGDIDASIVSFLAKKEKISSDKVLDILNNDSGFKGITGEKDFRIIHKLAQNGNKKAILAIEMYKNQIVKYIGAYKSLLEKVDAIIFTGAIGEGADYLREDISYYFPNEKLLVIKAREEISLAREAFYFKNSKASP